MELSGGARAVHSLKTGGVFMKKVVLVTGCSSGFGRALCVKLHENGYFVAATARKISSLQEVPADMKLSLDVCSDQSVAAAVNEVVAVTGRIDVLVNNAGFSARSAVEEIDVEQAKQMFDTNVFGTLRMMQAVLPVMRKHGCGSILNVGSISGRMTGMVNGGYCATKYAVEALTEAARYEVSRFGIEVAVLEPGAMDTGFFDALASKSSSRMTDSDSAYHELYLRDIALREKQHRAKIQTCAAIAVKIIGRRRLHVRYTVAVPLMFRLFVCLPDRIKEILIQRFN